MVVGVMMYGNDVELAWSTDGVHGNNTLGVGMRRGYNFGVVSDVKRGSGG